MKIQIFSLRNATTVVLLLVFLFGQNLQAQNAPSTRYFEVTKLKKMNDDFMDVNNEIIKPYMQERIKQGNLLTWALFRVIYPYSENADYDYVAFNVVGNFDHLHLGEEKMMSMAYKVFPNAEMSPIIDRFDASADDVGSQVFVLTDEAVPGPPAEGNVPKFIQVNHMKVAEANMNRYARMESDIFKPLHKARIKAGKMNDWLLLQRILPFGSEWDNTYLTMDLYNNWSDIAGGGTGDLFAMVHPSKDSDATWENMAKLRELRRAEIWEVVMVVNKPAAEVTYDMVKEGKGASPQRGQEVKYQGKVMNTKGETLIGSDVLGFDFYHIIGSDPYNRFFDKGLLQMKKGGIMTMTVPPDAQDKGLKGMLGGETAVVKVELADFAEPKPDGAAMLKRNIKEHGLDAAKTKYDKLKGNNPKGYVFREGAMNIMGYELLGEGHHEAAIYVFELNTKLYPKSWNAHDSLADAYLAKGSVAMARKHYEMALKINPDFQASKNKLAEL